MSTMDKICAMFRVLYSPGSLHFIAMADSREKFGLNLDLPFHTTLSPTHGEL